MRTCPFLSLSTGSTTVFYLLRVCLEDPWGDQGIMVEDPEEPWVGEVIATEETSFGEPIRV